MDQNKQIYSINPLTSRINRVETLNSHLKSTETDEST